MRAERPRWSRLRYRIVDCVSEGVAGNSGGPPAAFIAQLIASHTPATPSTIAAAKSSTARSVGSR